MTLEQANELMAKRSLYGCGAVTCKACYPVQWCCDNCGVYLNEPLANGEAYDCDNCGYESGEQ